MNKNFWKFFISVPAVAIIYMPLLLLWLEFGRIPLVEFSWLHFGLAFLLLWGGILMVMWAYLELTKEGEANFLLDIPAKKLITDGPYAYVRNPIAIGIWSILLGEAIYFGSWYVFLWTLIVVEAQSFYITHKEEYKLANKFGQAYVEYKMDVGKYWPKWSAWRKIFTKNKEK